MLAKPRLVWLDVLRAIAVFAVIGSHLPAPPAHSAMWLVSTSSFLDEYGGYGVELFFVLSGFLVSGLLFREYQKHRELRIKRFLIRRGLKLYPAFYVFLVATALLRYLLGDTIGIKGILAEVFFVQNYFEGIWTHTWSLAVEEHFYFGVAMVVALLAIRSSRDPFTNFPAIFLATTAAVLICRYQTFVALPYSFRTHRAPTHLQVDSLLFGVVLCYWLTFRQGFSEVVAKHLFCISSLSAASLLCFWLLDGIFAFTVGHVLLYVGFGGFVLVAASVKAKKAKPVVAMLAFVGAHSYSIYLWHTAVLVFGQIIWSRLAFFEVNWLTGVIVYVAAAVGWGMLTAKMVELPVLRFRDQLFPSRTLSI